MEHHLPFLPDYICTGHWQYEDGYQQCIRLMNLPDPPAAIFSMSDVMTYGAMNAMRSMKKEIPADFSIIGFDNLLKGCEPEEHSVYLECNLVERDSVAPR